MTLTIEINDSTAMTFDDAIGLATYSNSKTMVSSCLSIFEALAAKLHGKKKDKKENNLMR
jgi:hypothetical protein